MQTNHQISEILIYVIDYHMGVIDYIVFTLFCPIHCPSALIDYNKNVIDYQYVIWFVNTCLFGFNRLNLSLIDYMIYKYRKCYATFGFNRLLRVSNRLLASDFEIKLGFLSN